jgi:carbon storage regulator
MLVLSRKKNEKIIIGGNIEIKVVEILGGKVKLGVDAPKEVSVHRHEVYEAIQKEMKENYGSNLEGKVGEDIRKFRGCLESGEYASAYRELMQSSYVPSGDEINILKTGLEEIGRLSQLKKDKLENYLS